MEEKEFKKVIKKVNGPREHIVTNSLGTYDAFKYYRKNKPKEKEYIIKEVQYFKIIRLINKLLRDDLCKGLDIKFPYKLGNIEVRKNNIFYRTKDGTLKRGNSIDWDATLKLWYEDEQSYKDKFLVKSTDTNLFKIIYNKTKAIYKNKSFYQFFPNRELKLRLKHSIKYNDFDAFEN